MPSPPTRPPGGRAADPSATGTTATGTTAARIGGTDRIPLPDGGVGLL